MSTWPCPACQAVNDAKQRACEACGTMRATVPGVRVVMATECSGCGAPIDASGWCRQGNGYQGSLGAPGAVCETCRRPVTWAGVCWTCRTIPGDGYVWEAGHYVLERKGHGRPATAAEASAAAEAIYDRLARAPMTPNLPAVSQVELAEQAAALGWGRRARPPVRLWTSRVGGMPWSGECQRCGAIWFLNEQPDGTVRRSEWHHADCYWPAVARLRGEGTR